MTPAAPPALDTFVPLRGPAAGLDGAWRAAPAHNGAGLTEGYADPDFDDSGWREVRLPHLRQSTAEQDTLWYRCRFERESILEALQAGGPPAGDDRWLLCFGGAFYTTQVWLNGESLGCHEGYFQPFAYDVTGRLRAGSNVLAVCCRFPVEAGAFKRKTAVAGIFADWDCKPYPSPLYPNLPQPNEWAVPIGLWQAVGLRRSGQVLIESLNVFPEIEQPAWPAQPEEPGAPEACLRIRACLRNLAGEAVSGFLAVDIAPHNFSSGPQIRERRAFRLEGFEASRVEFDLRLPQPRLWFPWSHGHPWLYQARASIEIGPAEPAPDRWDAEQVFGVRQIRADFGPGRWDWWLNGRRIFPKGSNYISDFYLDRVSLDGLARDLELAREANLDLLRVHAHIAPLPLYRLCDARGMMVMCDFPLIWTYAHDLPAAEAAAFQASVSAQAEDMVDLLASRPSIALWSMHNEPPWTPNGEFLGNDVHQAQTNFALDNASAALVAALDPTRPVIPASGLNDQHLYHGWYIGNWQDNRQLEPPFPTEFGVQALPNPDSPFWTSVNSDWPIPADDPTWAHAGYQSLFWASPGVGPPASFASLPDYIAEGQAYQAFYIRYTIDQWRRRKFQPTGGYAHFLFTDGWPAITWSVLDYYRLPKAGYEALAEASRPVRLCLDLGGDFTVENAFYLVYPIGGVLEVGLHLVNDNYRLSGPALVAWWLERRGKDRVRNLLGRAAGRLRAGRATLPLPAADQPAQFVRLLRFPLAQPGQYTLRTQVSARGRTLDSNRLDFRVGQPQQRAKAKRRVPRWLVNKIYQPGSLQRTSDGFTFFLRNPAMPVAFQRLGRLRVDGTPVPAEQVDLVCGGVSRRASTVSPSAPLDVPSGQRLAVVVRGPALPAGVHEIEITAQVLGLGEMSATVRDRLA